MQELTKLHKGLVSVESTFGQGTTFTVHLPLGKEHLPATQIGAERPRASTETKAEAFISEALRWLPDDILADPVFGGSIVPMPVAASGRARVLLADDNADMREYLARLLLPRFSVLAVANGAKALAAARRERPDLILTDVMMPVLDGFGLLKAIREDPALHDLPVIMLSARAGEESRVEGLSAGADDYLVKPFSARELLARVAVNLELSRARREAMAAIRDSEERFRAFVTASSDAVYRMSADWSEMRQLAGKEFIADTSEPSRNWLTEYIYPDDQPAVMSAIQQSIRTKSPFALEHRVLRPDGSLGWTFSRAIPLFNGDGDILEWFGTASDVTDRKRHEERQQMLLNELNHRVKNTLAMVQSIARQTLRNATSLSDCRDTLSDRLIALARAHDILTREHWEGAELRDVVTQAVAAYAGAPEQKRLRITGPALRVGPKAALTLAMALHELATNGVKYGALSTETGSIEVTWTVQGEPASFVLRWAESGGPAVIPPQKRGFGSWLIEQGLSQDLGGEARLTFPREGLVCEISAPIGEIRALPEGELMRGFSAF